MQQLSIDNAAFTISQAGLSLRLIPQFLTHSTADSLLEQLIKTSPWQQPKLKVYGKWHPTPRLLCFYANHALNYKYSNASHQAHAWTPQLLDLKQRIQTQTAHQYNSVLLNYYRDGHDTMGWHADDEPELGHQPNIASLTLGAERDIFFKPKTGATKPIKLSLPSGSLLIMQDDTQKHWLHHIPKRLRCKQARINLTFRMVYPQQSDC